MLGRQKIYITAADQDMLNQAYAWSSQSCIGELTIVALCKLYYISQYYLQSHKRCWVMPCLNTHDGAAIRVHKNTREIARKIVGKAFNIPLTFKGRTAVIPVEIGFGPNFEDIEKGSKEVVRC